LACFLEPRSFGQETNPWKTKPHQQWDEEKNAKGPIQNAIFFFPKTTFSGTPTISVGEKEVQFSCKIADSTVRVGFRPQEMVDHSGPAL